MRRAPLLFITTVTFVTRFSNGVGGQRLASSDEGRGGKLLVVKMDVNRAIVGHRHARRCPPCIRRRDSHLSGPAGAPVMGGDFGLAKRGTRPVHVPLLPTRAFEDQTHPRLRPGTLERDIPTRRKANNRVVVAVAATSAVGPTPRSAP